MHSLKSCPFCRDPMQERGGQIMHLEQTPGCPMRDLSLPAERADDWNTRTPDPEALEAAFRLALEVAASEFVQASIKRRILAIDPAQHLGRE